MLLHMAEELLDDLKCLDDSRVGLIDRLLGNGLGDRLESVLGNWLGERDISLAVPDSARWENEGLRLGGRRRVGQEVTQLGVRGE